MTEEVLSPTCLFDSTHFFGKSILLVHFWILLMQLLSKKPFIFIWHFHITPRSEPGTDVWFLKYFRRKIWLKYLPFFVQTIASFYKNFAENWQKSQKIVITTSTPGFLIWSNDLALDSVVTCTNAYTYICTVFLNKAFKIAFFDPKLPT
jgi:hypothetical protein